MSEGLRETEVFIDNKWIPTEFQNIKQGVTFRTFEDDGTIVRDHNLNEIFIAKSDAYLDENEVWTVDI